MGTPEFAVPILESINASKHNLLGVYTQPPKKKFRGQKKTNSPIHHCANELKISVRCPEKLDDIEYNFIKKMNPNVVVVVAYGKIIPQKILDLPNILFINIHTSILPKWRGAAPIQRAIMNMEEETGISIMKITNKLDAGPVMKIFKIKINEDSNYETLSKKISESAASIIIDCLQILENKKEIFVPQDDSKATYAKKIEKSEAKINWRDSARKIIAKINAFHPNPGAWFELNGSRIKVLKAKEIKKTGSPGEIIDDDFIVGCSENAVQILELKKEGKKSMNAFEFLKGNKLEIGTKINAS